MESMAGKHGPDRLYDKFEVTKKSSGKRLDEEKEFFFVLRPEKEDPAARIALRAYAMACREMGYPNLAREIIAKLGARDDGLEQAVADVTLLTALLDARKEAIEAGE